MRTNLAALGALLLMLGSACRPRLDPVQVPPRVATSTAASAEACWIESRGKLGFTASAILVHHPLQGTVLIDAGNSSNFDAEVRVYRGKTKRWLRTFPGALKPKVTLDALLTGVGFDPGTLRAVIPTHAHLDHVGGILDLPKTPVWVSEAEAALIERGRHSVTFEVIPAHAKALSDQLEPLEFAGGPYEIFKRHADVFGDGSVVVVPMPGHTPGSVGVFVRLPDGRRVFHVGDAINSRTQLERLRGRTPAMRRTDTDQPAADRNVARLRALSEQDPSLLILPAHERAAWKEVFGAPASLCPAAS
ncbi:MAG: MBL fold metallo-hydrolase [Nannocystaceae bacterium]|nr:MBL fold metallo-hydrolase [Nannocystaceae bacterium]